jgi:peptidoglycan/LPS O-acetylase OafA/YrhL
MDDNAGAAPVKPHARLSQLDGLRGLAALVIMLYHAQLVYRADGPFSRGYLFVDLFFLLSGFVLAVSTEKKLNAGIGAVEFTWARYKRLFPLVAVGVGVALARALTIGLADPLTLLTWLALDLAMIPSLAGAGPFYRFNGPQWTLFWELAANFVHALILKRVRTKALPLLAAGFAALLVYTVREHGSDTLGVSALTRHDWWTPIPRVAFPYILGVWLGRKYNEGLRTPGLPWPLAMALPVAGILMLPSLPLGHGAGDLLFVILFLPVMMWSVAMCRPPARLMPAMDWFGTYSLPLYCVHLTILVWISELLGRGTWVRVLAIAVSLVVAYAFLRLISFKARPTQAKPKPQQA